MNPEHLIAELRSGTAAGREVSTLVQAANAENLVINGRGNRVSIAQATDGGVITTQPDQTAPPFWTGTRIIGAGAVRLATIVETALIALQFVV